MIALLIRFVGIFLVIWFVQKLWRGLKIIRHLQKNIKTAQNNPYGTEKSTHSADSGDIVDAEYRVLDD